MGVEIFGSGFPILSNAVVSVQTATVSQVEGGTVESFATIVSDINVLITQHSGGRSENFGTDAERWKGTCSGTDFNLDYPNARLLITAHDNLPNMVGWYLRITSSQTHPAAPYDMIPALVRCQVTKLELPAVTG